MVESEDQRNPLIEKFLRQLRFSCNRVRVIPEPFQKLGRFFGAVLMVLMLAQSERRSGEKHNESVHSHNCSHTIKRKTAPLWISLF